MLELKMKPKKLVVPAFAIQFLLKTKEIFRELQNPSFLHAVIL